MGEVWRYLIAEIQALGWRCFALGPEFWLVMPLALGLAVGAVIAVCDIWRGGRK